MAWELETKDGIVLRGIPDDIPADDPRLKGRVTQARSQRAGAAPAEPYVQRGASGTWAEPPSFASRVVKGLSDPLDASAQLLSRVLPERVMGGSAAELDNEIRAREGEYQRSRGADAGFDGGRALGNIVATAPLALAGPGAAATLPARIAAGAATSAASGALQPVTQGENFAAEKAKQVGVAAAFGGAAAPIASGAARVVRPNTRREVQTLIDEGVTPTIGQIMGGAAQRVEDKARSIPIVGDAITAAQRSGVEDLNRAAYARALAPIGGRVPRDVGHAAVDDVHRQLSGAYDNLLPRLQFKADPQFGQELATLHQMATQLPPAQAERFEQILRNQVLAKMTPQGNASGVTIKQIESELGRLVRGYSSDPAIDNRLLGDALRETQATIRRTLQRTNPAHADELANINRGYSELTRIENAAGRSGSAGGVFTPAQLDAAVRAGDTSVRKNGFARRNAQMQDLSAAGREVLGSKYPDSGTAGRLLFSAGAGGGAAFLEPSILSGAALASLPYLPVVRRAFAALMTQRPQAAGAIADRMRQLIPPAGAVAAPALYPGSRE
jgi:hypothetical protein